MPQKPRLQEIPLDELRPNPEQPRKTFDVETLEELAASIENHGLIQPIVAVANGDGYTIVAGERRYRAVDYLGWENVNVLVLADDDNVDELALVENVQREDLHPLDEAEAMERLMERHSYTQEDLAGVIGKARSTVANTLRLNELPKQIKKDCRKLNNVPKSVLLEVAGLPEDERLPFWEELRENGFTVRQARKRKKGGKPRKKKTQAPAGLLLRAGKAFHDRLETFCAVVQDDEEAEIGDEDLEALDVLHQRIGELLAGLKEGRDNG